MEVDSKVDLSTQNPNSSEDNLAWVEKYRPKTLDELVSQDSIVTTLQKYIDLGGLPHLLFYGPPGTGKTSTILALAAQLYGKKYRNMVLELNASDDRGIDVVRDQIKNFAMTMSVFGSAFSAKNDSNTTAAKYKLIILDEADSMTQAAQAALRRIIEKYTKNVRFCIICNYASKIIPAIQSRCTKFRFTPLSIDQISDRVEYIIKTENVSISPDAVRGILEIAKGDMRRVLNVLQSCYLAYDNIDLDAVYDVTGQPKPSDLKLVFNSLLNDQFDSCYQYISNLKLVKGIALTDIITNLLPLITDCKLPGDSIIYLINSLASIEYRLANSSTDDIQLTAMIGYFKLAVEMAAQ
ncbi:hypothetical protein BB560_001312 [Smittium megazygosporum]|uniref:AAA+ ATPase domain-containing protein n=1 Tax=Smittium megazygosporum TaxID=133381 RepID=A0A2T9ZHW2_9FUNG|nr:hypothetical protein BB560_001312 [Smittium megazygosporum]